MRKIFTTACALSLVVLFSSVVQAASASYGKFDADAKGGKHLTVAFFGASLTWGANSSDHARTSYRARVAQNLTAKYPEAHFTFIDGAIGGTGSNLGVFRLQRDCLKYKPDLVFLDFSANDDIYKDDPETLATYESLVRRIITVGKCPAAIVIFPFKWNSKPGTAKDMKGRLAHIKIAKAYNVPVGDAILRIQNMVAKDKELPEKIWNLDAIHPGDYGYQIFADAAIEAFEKAVKTKIVCKAPAKMMNKDTYMKWSRTRLSQLKKLPVGWKATHVNRTSAWYDAYMARWLDDVVGATSMTVTKDKKTKKEIKTKLKVDPLIIKFKASSVMIFGEKTMKSSKYIAFVDGKPCTWEHWGKKKTVFDANSSKHHGNAHLNAMLMTDLDTKVVHTLEIRPIFEGDEPQELRIESICLAGGEAKIIE